MTVASTARPSLPDVVTTSRLVLRPWRLDDVGDAFALARDPEWGRFLPLPDPYTEADAVRFVAAQLLLDRREHPSWAIEHDGRTVGGINVRFFESWRIAELGYSIARPLWGQGLMTEAVRAVVDLVFHRLADVNRIRAMANAENVGSRRVLEKCGFRHEGVLRANRYIRNRPVDEAWYGVLRADRS
jgi:ribosomal-protein-alanine N-acetyltransferase